MLNFLAVLDVMTMKYAIYFLVPPIVLYVVALLCAAGLTLATESIVDRDLSRESAVGMMVWVASATIGVSVMSHWITRSPLISVVNGTAVFFLVGAIIYSRCIKEFREHGRERVASIGLRKGLVISTIVTAFVLPVTLLVLWVCGYVG